MTTIYLDLDGVLSDFDRGLRDLCHINVIPQNEYRSEEYITRMWHEIRKINHFYGNLPLMPGARLLFDCLYERYGNHWLEILTAIPAPERHILQARQDKIQWVQNHISDNVRINIVLQDEKIRFCTGRDTVLIDDRLKTVSDWRKKGGIAILHITAENTLAELVKLGLL